MDLLAYSFEMNSLSEYTVVYSFEMNFKHPERVDILLYILAIHIYLSCVYCYLASKGLLESPKIVNSDTINHCQI